MAKGQLRHIAISVPDKEKTAKFYEMWSDCLAGRQRGPWRCTLSRGSHFGSGIWGCPRPTFAATPGGLSRWPERSRPRREC